MVSNRDVIIIWLQRILWTTVHGTHTESMISSSIKVGVVANEHGQVHYHIFLSMERRLTKRLVIPQHRRIGRILR